MKKALGIKSIKFAVLELIGFVLSLAFVICFSFVDEGDKRVAYIMIPIMSCVALYTLWLAASTLFLPKVVISYDDNGIYLEHKGGLFIPYEKIVNVSIKEARAKHHTYSFGHIIIHTTSRKYKIGVIQSVNFVGNEIMLEKHKKAERMFE